MVAAADESTCAVLDPPAAARTQLIQWAYRGRGPRHWVEAGRLILEHGASARAALHLGRLDWPDTFRRQVDVALELAGFSEAVTVPMFAEAP